VEAAKVPTAEFLLERTERREPRFRRTTVTGQDVVPAPHVFGAVIADIASCERELDSGGPPDGVHTLRVEMVSFPRQEVRKKCAGSTD